MPRGERLNLLETYYIYQPTDQEDGPMADEHAQKNVTPVGVHRRLDNLIWRTEKIERRLKEAEEAKAGIVSLHRRLDGLSGCYHRLQERVDKLDPASPDPTAEPEVERLREQARYLEKWREAAVDRAAQSRARAEAEARLQEVQQSHTELLRTFDELAIIALQQAQLLNFISPETGRYDRVRDIIARVHRQATKTVGD